MKKINILMLCVVVCMTAVAKNNTIISVGLENTANVAVLADDNDPKKKSSKKKEDKKKKEENTDEKSNSNADLEEKIAKLEEENAKLKKENAEKEEQSKKEQAEREKEKEKEKQEQLAKEKKIREEYDKAKADIDKLRQVKQKEVDSIKKRIIAQNNEIKRLEQRLNELKQDTAEVTEKLKEAQAEKNALADYRNKTTEFLASGADFWLQKPYSAITVVALDSVLNEYESISELAKEKSVDGEKAKIAALRENITHYNKAKYELANKYDAVSVRELLPILRNMKIVNSDTQKEVSELIKQLEYYPKQVEMFKTFIADVEGKIMENSRAASEVRINLHLDNEDQQKTIAEINKNPWLKKQYELYLKLLKKDYKKDNQYALLIKSIKTQ